ncbi:hypothetical protein Tco_1471242 [Tanacetum coccineum]
MDANENSHEITIRIHEVQYSTVVAKLRKVFQNTDRMKFIKGLQSEKDYFILTLETRDKYAVSLYVHKEDLKNYKRGVRHADSIIKSLPSNAWNTVPASSKRLKDEVYYILRCERAE